MYVSAHLPTIMNNNEEQQHVAENNEMSYIDRVVFQAGGTADDVKESAILAGEQGGENVADDSSIWSEANDSDADESSDEKWNMIQMKIQYKSN